MWQTLELINHLIFLPLKRRGREYGGTGSGEKGGENNMN